LNHEGHEAHEGNIFDESGRQESRKRSKQFKRLSFHFPAFFFPDLKNSVPLFPSFVLFVCFVVF